MNFLRARIALKAWSLERAPVRLALLAIAPAHPWCMPSRRVEAPQSGH